MAIYSLSTRVKSIVVTLLVSPCACVVGKSDDAEGARRWHGTQLERRVAGDRRNHEHLAGDRDGVARIELGRKRGAHAGGCRGASRDTHGSAQRVGQATLHANAGCSGGCSDAEFSSHGQVASDGAARGQAGVVIVKDYSTQLRFQRLQEIMQLSTSEMKQVKEVVQFQFQLQICKIQFHR